MTQAEKGDAENGKEKGGEKEKEQRGVKRPIVPAQVPESLQEVRRRGRGSGGPVPAWDLLQGWRPTEASGPRVSFPPGRCVLSAHRPSAPLCEPQPAGLKPDRPSPTPDPVRVPQGSHVV